MIQVGDIVTLSLDKETIYVYVVQINEEYGKIARAYNSKKSVTLSIWAKPSNIFVETNDFITVKLSNISKSSLWNFKNKQDALERILQRNSKTIKNIHNRTSNSNRGYINKIKKKLGYSQGKEIISVANSKPCQGGNVSPK